MNRKPAESEGPAALSPEEQVLAHLKTLHSLKEATSSGYFSLSRYTVGQRELERDKRKWQKVRPVALCLETE